MFTAGQKKSEISHYCEFNASAYRVQLFHVLLTFITPLEGNARKARYSDNFADTG